MPHDDLKIDDDRALRAAAPERPPSPPTPRVPGGPSGAALEATEPDTETPNRSPLTRLRSLVRAAVPWGSLAAGVLGAVLMDHGIGRAAWVAAAALGLWLILMLLTWVQRLEQSDARARPTAARALWLARHSSVFFTQSVVQLCLFFAWPFYFRASMLPGAQLDVSTVDPGHLSFMLGLSLLCGISLWDPWTEWLLGNRLLSPFLPAAASFAALNAVLPGLGLSTHVSLWLAAGTATLGAAALIVIAAPLSSRPKAARRGAAALIALPVALALGGARLIPPAPLRLMRADFGTRIEGKWVVESVTRLDSPPERLICATAIQAPVGLRDRLFHVWDKDGSPISKLELEVVGGREQGYRTRSWLRHFGPSPNGRYGCSVRTAAGQVLGTRHVVIGPPG